MSDDLKKFVSRGQRAQKAENDVIAKHAGIECTCDLKVYGAEATEDGHGMRLNVKLQKCPLCEAAPELVQIAKQMLRELSDDGITGETARALKAAIEKAERRS